MPPSPAARLVEGTFAAREDERVSLVVGAAACCLSLPLPLAPAVAPEAPCASVASCPIGPDALPAFSLLRLSRAALVFSSVSHPTTCLRPRPFLRKPSRSSLTRKFEAEGRCFRMERSGAGGRRTAAGRVLLEKDGERSGEEDVEGSAVAAAAAVGKIDTSPVPMRGGGTNGSMAGFLGETLAGRRRDSTCSLSSSLSVISVASATAG